MAAATTKTNAATTTAATAPVVRSPAFRVFRASSEGGLSKPSSEGGRSKLSSGTSVTAFWRKFPDAPLAAVTLNTTSRESPSSDADGAFQMKRWVFDLRIAVYRLPSQLTPRPPPRVMSLPNSSNAPYDAVSITSPSLVTHKTCRALGLKDASETMSACGNGGFGPGQWVTFSVECAKS